MQSTRGKSHDMTWHGILWHDTIWDAVTYRDDSCNIADDEDEADDVSDVAGDEVDVAFIDDEDEEEEVDVCWGWRDCLKLGNWLFPFEPGDNDPPFVNIPPDPGEVIPPRL